MKLLAEEKQDNNLLEIWHLPDGRHCFYKGAWRTYHYELVYKWLSSSGGVQGSDCELLTKKTALEAGKRGLFKSFNLF